MTTALVHRVLDQRRALCAGVGERPMIRRAAVSIAFVAWCVGVGLGCAACTSSAPLSSGATDAGGDAASGTTDASNDATMQPDAGPDDLSATLDPIRAAAGMPAMAGAVWRGDALIAVGASGVRKQGDATVATIRDQWHLGSDTKAMTATLIGLYVDRQKIRFEDTIATLFAGEAIDPAYAPVTLEQLLQHRGGAPGTMPADIWSQMWSDGAAADARLKAVRALLSRAPAQAPGTFVYANAGYMIAGAALERALAKAWDQIITDDLFRPLHMDSCGFGAPGVASKIDQPWGHQVTNGVPSPVAPGPGADNPPSLGPAGTVHCSLADWGRFLAVHLAGARGEPTIVSKATMTRLQMPPSGGDYADGWVVTSRSWAGGTALTHSGSNTMWYATAWIAPAKNLTFAVVTNRGDNAAATAVDDAFGPLIQRYAP